LLQFSQENLARLFHRGHVCFNVEDFHARHAGLRSPYWGDCA
jgi:hypothetical protein